ncbi:carboxy-S-adenosyl-L-methionine synthase CmoA [Kangiella sp. TOML190]|uniref:carboxy-S-adenosyl-L-methionine synthase CmoA n=1 Tax=Kangiella sp. TOML190 TaxID=2931351 RepID=UPI00203BC602|nr:carboxy-S-adenosyl-L-methionine synthase CmoA [Kangiella sp. TOML190]
MSAKDDIFLKPQENLKAFEFNQQVVEVFPDMIERSVPGYKSIIEGIGQIAKQYVQENSQIYDLGCSLGAASFSIRQGVSVENSKIIAVDNSKAMVERCRLIQDGYKFSLPIEVMEADITQIPIRKASLVVLNFTLQFLPIAQRQTLLDTIYQGLEPGGALILSEKIQMAQPALNNKIIELHHRFKKHNGYSDMEIAQKRAALENVLIPESCEQHMARFKATGFSQYDTWFQHYNFVSFLAVK